MAETTKQERRKVFIEALRSGKYHQTRDRLGKKFGEQESYCCLGVACEIAMTLGLSVAKETKPSGEADTNIITYDGKNGTLPPSVINFYGFKTPNGGNFHDGDTLADINDNGASFEKIADAIESQSHKLFTED